MRRNLILFSLLICAGSMTLAQTPAPAAADPPAKQTARQALIEMFLGKGQDDFVKHLPDDAQHTLIHHGDTPEGSWPLRFAQIGRELTSQGDHVETFDTGPNILVMDEQEGHTRLEVSVEQDSLAGDSDEIELSFRYYKDGQEVALPVVPRLTFTMEQDDKDVWRLNEVTAAAHVPLTDLDYLHALRKQQDQANESMIRMRVNMIVAAETGYAARRADHGYACSLSTLFAAQAGAPEAGQPQNSEEGSDAPGNFYDPGQGNEEWNGYRFSLSGCNGTPASKYLLTAAPNNPDADTKTFCANESGAVKFITGDKASSCISQGEALSAPTPATSSVD